MASTKHTKVPKNGVVIDLEMELAMEVEMEEGAREG